MATSSDLTAAPEQVRFARWFTAELLSDVPQERWFEMPAGNATHIAWQVGHLTVRNDFWA